MARQESNREDLMREATALVRRIELALPGRADSLVAGWRTGGALSLYFGPDEVYHFDGDGRLRRAFVAGRLYRTQGTTLARLTRQRTPAVTELHRHDLTAPESERFIGNLRRSLRSLQETLTRGEATAVQQIPAEAPLIADLTAALHHLLATGPPLAPAIRGKR